jgi:hypothetical protein
MKINFFIAIDNIFYKYTKLIVNILCKTALVVLGAGLPTISLIDMFYRTMY